MTDETKAPAQRRQWLLASGVFGLCVAGLTLWYLLAVRQDYVVLYSALRPAQAAAIIATLDEEGVAYRLAAGGADILVSEREADQLRVKLGPANGAAGGIDGFELFNEADMGLTDFAQKIRYQRALQGEIARTIMMIEGVADARVHVTMPERALFRSERRAAEAAVTLAAKPGVAITPATIEGIQRLVAAAVGDLDEANVVVLDARGEVLSSRAVLEPLGQSAAPSGAYLIEVVRLAIPERRFDVALEDIPASLEGGDGEAFDPSPRRLFTITTESLLAPEEQARVRTRLEQAGLLDGSSRQVLAFRVERLALAPASSLPPGPAAEPQTASAPVSQSSLWTWIAAILALLAVAGAAAFGLRSWLRPTLSFEEHTRIAERLGLELSEARDG